jgi:hypothetical protein
LSKPKNDGRIDASRSRVIERLPMMMSNGQSSNSVVTTGTIENLKEFEANSELMLKLSKHLAVLLLHLRLSGQTLVTTLSSLSLKVVTKLELT